jgi:hypothetical protein
MTIDLTNEQQRVIDLAVRVRSISERQRGSGPGLKCLRENFTHELSSLTKDGCPTSREKRARYGPTRYLLPVWQKYSFQTCACRITLPFPSGFLIPSRFRIGAVNMVVTKAMMTIMVKSVGVKAPTL